jgi:hypothetical protein
MVERTISIHENLLALAANVFQLRHESLEVAGGQGEQKPIAGPIRHSVHDLKPRRDRISSEGTRCDANHWFNARRLKMSPMEADIRVLRAELASAFVPKGAP